MTRLQRGLVAASVAGTLFMLALSVMVVTGHMHTDWYPSLRTYGASVGSNDSLLLRGHCPLAPNRRLRDHEITHPPGAGHRPRALTLRRDAMAKIGYARVSTRDQNTDSQLDELRAAGCEPIFVDHGRSGKLASRPELDKCLASLREGDTLVITRLSRAGRSLKHMLSLAADLDAKGVGLQVLKQNIDTTTPTGRLVFHILAALDEFQRELIVEGTYEGLAAAKARGRKGGRKPGLDPRKVKVAHQLKESGASVAEIAQTLSVSRATVYRHLEMPARP